MSAFLPAAGRATVVVIDPAAIAEETAAASLTAAEREHAARFHFDNDARHWRACRGVLRRILGEALALDPAAVHLEFGEQGKPRLPPPHHGLHFNLSHCRDLALVALCRGGPVGIDLEPAGRRPSLLGCESSFCHPSEIAALPPLPAERAAALLDLWTSKEALLKALGTGLSLPPETVAITAGNGSSHPLLREFRIHRLAHPRLRDHIARLAAPREIVVVEILEFPG